MIDRWHRAFNGDGKSDILWRDTSGNVAVWFMNGAQAQYSGLGNVPPSAWWIVETGDFNGDGKSDILWCDTSGNVALWFMRFMNGVQAQYAPVANVPTMVDPRCERRLIGPAGQAALGIASGKCFKALEQAALGMAPGNSRPARDRGLLPGGRLKTCERVEAADASRSYEGVCVFSCADFVRIKARIRWAADCATRTTARASARPKLHRDLMKPIWLALE
jgi:hypothetical protein